MNFRKAVLLGGGEGGAVWLPHRLCPWLVLSLHHFPHKVRRHGRTHMSVGYGRDLDQPWPVECAVLPGHTMCWGHPRFPACPLPVPSPAPHPEQWHSLASAGFVWAVVISQSLNVACVPWIVVRNLDFPSTPFFSIPNLAGRTKDCFCRLLVGEVTSCGVHSPGVGAGALRSRVL